MLIDWFTVVAQVVNFLILVWLLKRFLYRPIVDAIDAREQRVAAELANADALRTEAERERMEFQRRNEELDHRRAALLSEATDQARAEGQRLLEEAREAADALRTSRHEALRNEARELNRAIARRTRQEVYAVARRALADLAGSSLEQRLVEVFTRQLGALEGDPRTAFTRTLATASDPARVRSTFELNTEQRAALREAINSAFSVAIDVRFETDPELVSGIELTANGQKLAWSVADYLESLERNVDELLSERLQSAPEAGPAAGAEAEPAAAADAETGEADARTDR